MDDKITFLLSRNNFVYGIDTYAMELRPFKVFKKMVVGTTYLFGIKTLKIFATSEDIEDIIDLTANCVFKPLFLRNTIPGNVVTTQYEKPKVNVNSYFDKNKISTTTRNIIEHYDSKLEKDFISFCNDIVEEYETLELVEKILKTIEDADMMKQCNDIIDGYVEEVLMD